MQKTLLVATLLLSVAFAAMSEGEYQVAFTSWMQRFQKSYHHEQFVGRYQVFKSNLNFVNKHNSEGHSFTVALNEFADLTAEEFGRLYRGTRFTAPASSLAAPATPADASLPDHWNWNNRGAVTPIKNQQQCGSCWSFSTTGSTEGCNFLKKNKLVSLSEQNLMDCSWSQGNQGCNGGLMTQAMDYIIATKGLDTEASYPYTAQDGTCQYNAANSGGSLTSYVNVNTGDENDLQTKVAVGPTSVAIDASQTSFQLYSSGVYYEPACSSTQLDHGVLAVGWGTSSGQDYWIVKNSWGSSWGLNGFIWMSRNKQNNCGIATMATLPKC